MAAPDRWRGGYQIDSPVARRADHALAHEAINTDFATMTRPEWRISDGLVPYDEALETMEARVADIRAGRARRARLAAGASAALHRRDQRQGRRPAAADALSRSMPRGAAGNTPITGPASAWSTRCSTCAARRQDVRRFVSDLEEWTIRALARFNVRAERRAGRVGVWVARPGRRQPRGQDRRDRRRIRHWVSFHGLSINARARPLALCAASCPAASPSTA